MSGGSIMGKRTSMDVELLCTQCSGETVHRVMYHSDRIESVECLQCGRKISIRHDESVSTDSDPVHHVARQHLDRLYTQEFLRRILTKPKRVEDELKADLSLFLVTLPLRLISKPVRLLQDIFVAPDEQKSEHE